MPLLRTICNGEELDLSRLPLTAVVICKEQVYLYHPCNVKMMSPRGRSGKPKIYTQEEIEEFLLATEEGGLEDDDI